MGEMEWVRRQQGKVEKAGECESTRRVRTKWQERPHTSLLSSCLSDGGQGILVVE